MDFYYAFDFLARLQINNDRNWFHEHKFEYDEIRADFENFINRLIVPLAQLDPGIGSVTANESVFRIYRDTRFSHDKTPYKTHSLPVVFIVPTRLLWNPSETKFIISPRRYGVFLIIGSSKKLSPNCLLKIGLKILQRVIRKILRKSNY